MIGRHRLTRCSESCKESDSNGRIYTQRILREVDPHILKTFLLNAGFEAGLWATRLR